MTNAPLLQHLSTPELVDLKSLLDGRRDDTSTRIWALIIKEVAQRAGVWPTSEDEKSGHGITVKARLETILRDVDTLNVEESHA